jgi:DNA-binding transcriptional ArsR family regulator
MTAIYQSREQALEAAEKLKVYAQPQRLMILSRLLDGEGTVGEIEDATRIGQPALSQQLAELRRAELVETRRVAKQVFYRLANDNVALCVRSIEAIFGSGRDVAAALSGAMAARPRQTLIRRAGAAAFAQVE